RPPKRRDRVRLAVAIGAAGRSALDGQGVLRYRVTVRPIGGTAHDTALLVLAQRPLTWAGNPPECASRGSGAPLRCDLGDLVHVRHVEVAVRLPERARLASVPRVVAIAGASNVRRESVAAATPPVPVRSPRPE
ncbi:hypothetical protein ACSNOI_47585, partial [Actinomadura kijaniata]|uniref:hypothetical protein n=1 Tax=Actinomadura kijaniata TaxID=46161 RepID=UPI003F1A3B79